MDGGAYAPGGEGSDEQLAVLGTVLDRVTWPAVALRYIRANMHDVGLLRALSRTEYPVLTPGQKISILNFLAAQFAGVQVCAVTVSGREVMILMWLLP